MKKLLSILLTIVMAVCLVNLNNNYTKAEEVEEIEENEVTEIHNANELINFLKDEVDNKFAKLANNITYDAGGTTEVTDIKLYGNKTLDLNGKNITFKECLSLRWSDEAELNIVNGDSTNDSTLKASKDIFGSAMIATRLYKHSSSNEIRVNIGMPPVANISGGKIVFDGNNVDGVVGIANGYHSLMPHEEGYYDNNLSTINVGGGVFNSKTNNIEFKNFKSKNGLVSAALANGDGILNVRNAVIKDSDIGIASGRLDSNAYTGDAETNVSLSNITNCGIGIANGVYIGGLLFKEIEPNDVYVYGTEITGNKIGVQFHKERNDTLANETNGVFAIDCARENRDVDGSVIKENGVDYYCSGTDALYEINKIENPTTFSADLDFWKGAITYKIPVARVKTTPSNLDLYSLNEGLYAHVDSVDNKMIALSTIPDDTVKPIHETGDMYVVDGGFVAAFTNGKGSQAVAHIDGITYAEGTTNVSVYDIDNMEYLTKDDEFSCDSGSTKVIFNKDFINGLSIGKHEYVIFINDGQTTPFNYPFYVTFYISDNTPAPQKDESCEKVIGPTWHWNNKKGICEDTGVVKTYTR